MPISPLVYNPKDIPNQLADAPYWLTWSPKPHPTIANKTLKVPSSGKAWQKNLSSFDDLQPLSSTQGLGFAYTEDHPFICLDVDDFTEENLSLVKSLDSYTEVSPSGKGCHVVVEVTNKQDIIDVYGKGKRYKTYERDLFISTGFVTVTNNVTEMKPVRLIESSLFLMLLEGKFLKQHSHEEPTKQDPPQKQLPLNYVKSLLAKLPVQQLQEDVFEKLNQGESVFLDPNCSEEARTPWLMIGQALHHEYKGALKGFTLWTEWSKLGTKYDPDALDACWRGFDSASDRPITIGTIIKLAEAQFPTYPDIDSKGRLLGTINNFYTYLKFSGITSATNELTRQAEINITPNKQSQWETPIDGLGLDTISSLIVSDFLRLKTAPYAFSLQMCKQYLKASANSNFINPIKDYFTKCGAIWDGKDRMPELMRTISTNGLNDKYRPAYHQFLRKWLIQVVAAAAHEKNDHVRLNRILVFVGNQGIGKTMWVQSLFPKSLSKYCSADKDLKLGKFKTESTKLAMELSNTLICNLNEVDTQFRGSGFSDFKIFLDQTADQVVLPYGETPIEMTRRTCFIGSTNISAFLTDPTGNRRIEIITATDLDYKHEIDIDQLWGQMFNLYTQGEKWWFDQDNADDLVTITARDRINARAFAFADDSIAEDLDDMFDATAPIGEWKKLTLANIRALIGNTGNSGNSSASRNAKKTLHAWLEQIPNAPLPEKGEHARSRVYYWMPPLRTDTFPTEAFQETIAKEMIQ